MKFLLTITLLLCALASRGATITAAGTSAAQVQAALDSAVRGDIVIIPTNASPVTWTVGVTNYGKGIVIQAAVISTNWPQFSVTHGAGSAVLVDIQTDNQQATVVAGISFLAGAATGKFLTVDGGAGKSFLVYGCMFEIPSFQLTTGVEFSRLGGIVSSCTFTSNVATGSGSGCLQLKATGISSSWTRAATWGTADIGGTNNLYIENCKFFGLVNQCIDVDDNIRVVIRNNLFDGSQITWHSDDTSLWGARHGEIDDNLFVFHPSGGTFYSNPLNINRFVYIRGAGGIITGNTFDDINSGTWGNKPEVTAVMQNVQRTAGNFPCRQVADYPASVGHMVGAGYNGGATVDMLWMYTNAGSGVLTLTLLDYGADDCGNGVVTADLVKPGRDYTNGVPVYTRYTFPHPLIATMLAGTVPVGPTSTPGPGKPKSRKIAP